MKNIVSITKKAFVFYTIFIGFTALSACGDDDADKISVTLPKPPTIEEISPTSGEVGSTVTITGTNFSPKATENTVSFNGTFATVNASTITTIATLVPDGTTSGPIKISVQGKTVIGPVFTVNQPPMPSITSIAPISGTVGTEVTIIGTNFSTTASENIVSFNGTQSTVTVSTGTSITTTVPIGATSGTVSVVVNNQTANGPNFSVEIPSTSVFSNIVTSGVAVKLGKVQFVDANLVYAAGDDGTILKSTDAGVTWTDLTTNTGEPGDFEHLFFIDASTGWAVGDNGVVTKTTDGGTNWASQTASTGTTETLRSIFFLDNNNGYVGGSGGVLIHTNDGGTTWTPQTTGLETAGDRIYDIYFKDSDSGLAVAGGGNIISTSDGGATWAVQSDVNGMQESWKRVRFADVNNGWVVGSAGLIYKTTDGGATWMAQTSPTTEADFNDMIMIDSQNLIVVGDHNDARDITSIVVKTNDGGITWERDLHGLTDNADDIELNGIGTFNGASVLVVGDNGVILK